MTSTVTAHAALLRFGHAANEANDIGGALDAFESAFELQPGDAAAFLSAANMRLKLGHVEMAHAMYTWLLDQRRIPLAPRHVEMASRKLKAMGAPRTKDPPAEDSPDSITARLRRRYGDAGGETAAAVRSADQSRAASPTVPAPAPAAAGGLFGAAAAPAPAAAAPTLSFGAPAPAPAATLSFGAAAPGATPGAAPQQQQQLAAVPAPPADVRNKSVEEIVQGWKASLEADVAEFTKQTEQLREWENEIRASQREIVEVSAYAEKLVVAQQRTEKVLDEVRAYQDDLDTDLDAMERHVDDLFARSAVRPPLDADVEREHAYDLSVRLETQLGGMLDQLKDVVTKLNLSHDENGDEKSRDIMKIVNAHHQSLAYLSAQASKIEAEVVKLERANEAERRAQAAV